jgi:hypothetical protein
VIFRQRWHPAPGAQTRARRDNGAGKQDVPLLYWTAASWGSAIALGIELGILAIGVLLITYSPWLTLGILHWMGQV